MTREPVKGPVNGEIPFPSTGDLFCRETCRNQGLCFHGVLIDPRPFSTTREKSIRADGHEMALSGLLEVSEPFQGLQAYLDHLLPSQSLPTHQKRVREHRIAVSQAELKPMPSGRALPPITGHEPLP